MHTGHANSRWQRASGWGIILLIASTLGMIGLLPGGTEAQTQGTTPGSPSARPAIPPATTPVGDSPTITLTPREGPVKTLVTLQGEGWPPESQMVIAYDSDASCASPNLTRLPLDPPPTVNSAGAFSVSFHWPAVSATGTWYICAATSDGAATSVATFNVLSLSPPSLTILTKGPFVSGQTMRVQGQNWLPGGWYISFALQRVNSSSSFPLEESSISLFNGSFGPISITIPTYLPPGSYVLVATMEQRALEAQSSAFTIAATPTPTPTATPTPSPTPTITPTPTPIIKQPQTTSTPKRLSGPLLALVIISGGMALTFAFIGTALLIYLRRTRPMPSAPFALERYDEDT